MLPILHGPLSARFVISGLGFDETARSGMLFATAEPVRCWGTERNSIPQRDVVHRDGRESVMAMRLLHAASVQLDVPLSGVLQPPRELADLLCTATLTAWERLIEAAIAHDVDAVVLSGDTFDADQSSLAADVALRQGCEKLAEREIPLLVMPGPRDPLAAWQEIPDLPENVTIFDSPWDAPIELTDRGKTKAIFHPVSAETDISPPELDKLASSKKTFSDTRPFTFGLLWDAFHLAGSTAAAPRFASLDLLLASDRQPRVPLPVTEALVRRQPSPQGMTPYETGARGAMLIDVDSQRKTSARLLPLAPVRRERLTLRLDAVRSRDDLCDQMLARLDELPVLAGEQLRLVEWLVDGTTAAWKRLDLDEHALEEVTATLTELTDQPDKLRSLHRAAPLWLDPIDESQIGELWGDYLQLFDVRPEMTIDELRRMAVERRPQQALPDGAWERWLQQLSPQAIAARARGYGRRWFAGA